MLATVKGAGKTRAFIAKAFYMASLNIGYTGLLLEPTAPLLHDILIPEFEAFLQEYEIPYKLIKSPNPNLTIYFDTGETLLLLRSAENWKRLIGINAAFIGIDEFDTMKKEDALMAYQRLQGRLRAGKVRQMFITTTPESFNATYHLFEKEKIGRIIRASSLDNPFLPSDFIDDLKSRYTPEQLKAYIHGIFCNLTSGSVYSYFNRETCSSNETIISNSYLKEDLFIGADFNIGGCVNVVLIERAGVYHAVDEVVSNDSFKMAEMLETRYEGHNIYLFPDASGKNRKTSATKSDLEILRDSVESIIVDPSNPQIKDRVNAMNNAFEKGYLKVNTILCPRLTEALEQQAYDKNGEPEKFTEHPAIDDFNDGIGYIIAKLFPRHKQTYKGELTKANTPIKY